MSDTRRRPAALVPAAIILGAVVLASWLTVDDPAPRPADPPVVKPTKPSPPTKPKRP